MKVVKWIAIGLVVLVAAVAATFYAILNTLDTEELRGLIEAQAEKATGRKLRLAGPIDLSLSLTPAVVLQKVTFDNADWGSRPALLDVGRVEAQVALLPLLEGRYVIQRVVVSDADILLETDPQGEGNWALPAMADGTGTEAAGSAGEGQEQTVSGKPVIPEIGSIVVRNSRLVYRDGATGRSLLLGIDSLELTPEGDLMGVAADGSYQEVPFEIDGRIGGLPVLTAGGDLPVDLSGRIAGAAVSVEGRIDDLKGSATPDLRVALEAKSLSQFDKLAGLALPALGPLALGARVGLDAGLVTLDDLALTLGGSDLAGSLTASLAGERPSILADLTGARVDLSDFASAAAEQEAVSTAPGDRPADGSADQPAGQPEPATSDREAAGASPFVIPDTPLPLAALQAVDAEVALTLGELVVDPQTTLSDVALALRLENGRLEVSRLQAAAFEGRLDATLSLDAGQMPPALATRIDVEGLSLGKVTRAYAGTRDLESSLDLALDLQGRGDSPRALAASLNGSSEIVGGEGVVTNRILAIFASGLDEILGPLFGGRQETRLNCLVSRFRFEDGRAISQAQLVDSSTFSLAGTGTIDLRDERLDLKFDTRTREAALVSLAVPFVVTGTLADPRPAPDVLGSAMQVADFIKGGSNPLAALEQVVAGSAGVEPAAGTNGCLAALEQTADVPASETPLGTLRQGLDRALQGEDPRKALEDAARDALGEDALGEDSPAGDALRQGLDSLFKRD